MIVILRLRPGQHLPPELEPIATRPTPGYADAAPGTDHFVDVSADAADGLRASGLEVKPLGDGWYELPPGGVAVWSGGKYWELRDTVHTIVRAAPL